LAQVDILVQDPEVAPGVVWFATSSLELFAQ